MKLATASASATVHREQVYFMVFPAKVLNLNSDHQETSDKLKVRAILQSPQPVPWKTISVVKDKEKQMNVNT